MTHDNSEQEITNTLDAMFKPLAKSLRKMHRAIDALSDGELRAAVYTVEKRGPIDLEDEAASEAEGILLEALRAANAKRIAKNAPWLCVSIESNDGRPAVCVSHDVGTALWKEFSTDAEAQAAASAIHDFLLAEGRAESWPAFSSPADLDDLPF